jgi:hypothetical protein
VLSSYILHIEHGLNDFVVIASVQAQYQRMVAQEDSRLNKLVHVQMQCEPAVQDLAIQTEFVAPPVRTWDFFAVCVAAGVQ